MSGKRGNERAHGPYKHHNRFRVVIVGANGKRTFARDGESGSSSFASWEAAADYIAGFRGAADTRTLGEAVRDWLNSLKVAGQVKNSIDTARHRVYGLLGLVEGDRLLSSVTRTTARQLATQRAKEVAVDTMRGELSYASRCFQWCVEQGWIKTDPFLEIEAQGKRNRGKPQLRVDEARRFVSVATAEESAESTAVLMAILMGLRAHEIVGRVARDVDDGGRLLVIDKSKTRAGERTVVVPPILQVRLLALVAGKKPDAPIFGELTRYGVLYHAVRLSEEAGVPRVTPHGLRGTFASLAVTSQLPGYVTGLAPPTMEQVAKSIGHNDRGATMRRHYMAPGAEQSAGVAAVTSMLGETETSRENQFPGVNIIQPEVN